MMTITIMMTMISASAEELCFTYRDSIIVALFLCHREFCSSGSLRYLLPHSIY